MSNVCVFELISEKRLRGVTASRGPAAQSPCSGLSRERERAAIPRLRRGDQELTVLAHADGLDQALAELLAENRLAGRGAWGARVEIATLRARPAGDLRQADRLKNRALAKPVGEGVECRRAGTTPLAAALRLGIQHLVAVDLLGEAVANGAILAGVVAALCVALARRSGVR